MKGERGEKRGEKRGEEIYEERGEERKGQMGSEIDKTRQPLTRGAIL